MGLDRFHKTPCGFCFVEYYTHQDALDCMKYIGGSKLDERVIRTDLDPGFQEGRQYGYAQFSSSDESLASAVLTRVVTSDEGSLVDRFEMNTDTITTPDEVDLAAPSMRNVSKRRRNMVKAGN